MILQDAVGLAVLAGMALVALVFAYVIHQAGRSAPAQQVERAVHRAHVLQGWLFALLLLGFVVGSWATLRHFPIAPQQAGAGADAQQVQVSGRMWGWQLQPEQVRAGEPVEFLVTSEDVNHGFAIYAPDGHIVTQTQAMPGYTNRLRYTFEQPGRYAIQCLEYCGIGHGPMRSSLQVLQRAGAEEAQR